MPGKPDGKNRATKKSGPARKAAKRNSAFGKALKDKLDKYLKSKRV